MKTFKPLPSIMLTSLSAILFVLLVSLGSCSKSNTSPKTEDTGTDNTTTTTTNGDAAGETPFYAVVHDPALINGKTAYGQYGGAEIGYRIHFTTGGTVVKLGANMATAGKYIVSFWRTADAKLLGRVTVNNADTSKFAYAAVDAITVKPDTAYSLSINIPDGSKGYHFIYTWSPTRNQYPFTKGHVVADQVLDQAYLPVGTAPVYPFTVYSSDQAYIGSSCDLVFVPAK